jgi:hypothetical protein
VDPDPHCEYGSRTGSRRGKISPEKEEKLSLKTIKNGKNEFFLCNHISGKELGLKLFNVRKIR